MQAKNHSPLRSLNRLATTLFCLEISCISLGCEAYALTTFYESKIVIIMLSKYTSYLFIPMTAKFALLKPPLAKNNGAYLCLSILVTSFGVELQEFPVIQVIPCKSTRLVDELHHAPFGTELARLCLALCTSWALFQRHFLQPKSFFCTFLSNSSPHI
jgi:hypothetical protein